MITEIKPNEEEMLLAKWLQALFDFETNISYYIYDYGTRYCSIQIEEANEPYPMLHTNDDSLDWDRGENSIIVAKFARENLPKGENEWYCARKGFSIPIDKLQKLNMKNIFNSCNCLKIVNMPKSINVCKFVTLKNMSYDQIIFCLNNNLEILFYPTIGIEPSCVIDYNLINDFNKLSI